MSASGSYEFEPHDPPTLGAAYIGGKPYGILLQGDASHQVVVLDLNAMLAAPVSNRTLVNDPLAAPGLATLLTY